MLTPAIQSTRSKEVPKSQTLSMKDPDESPDVLHCKHCLPQDVSSSLKEAPSLVLCNFPKSDLKVQIGEVLLVVIVFG